MGLRPFRMEYEVDFTVLWLLRKRQFHNLAYKVEDHQVIQSVRKRLSAGGCEKSEENKTVNLASSRYCDVAHYR